MKNSHAPSDTSFEEIYTYLRRTHSSMIQLSYSAIKGFIVYTFKIIELNIFSKHRSIHIIRNFINQLNQH